MNSNLENYLHQFIPISAAMGIRVERASTQQIVLSAPIANNINHKFTVFGGSLHAVATLACWGLLHLNLHEKFNGHEQIVITESHVDYLAPVTADFMAETTLPAPDSWERFVTTLSKKGKSRIELKSKIYHGNKLCVDYTGTFAAIVKQTGAK